MSQVSIVHNVPLYQQPQTWACWYTSYQMVVAFYRNSGLRSNLIDPSEHPYTQKLFTDNAGIGTIPDEREKVAKLLNFSVLYASLSAEAMQNMLSRDPLIYSGRWPGMTAGHVVVLVGISGNVIYVNNPANPTQQQFDYQWLLSNYLLQTSERPIIYAA